MLFSSGLPQLPAYYDVRVSFQFRTLESNGLLMYNAGKGRDFLALELVDGHVHYIVCLGGHSEVTVLKDESPMVSPKGFIAFLMTNEIFVFGFFPGSE